MNNSIHTAWPRKTDRLTTITAATLALLVPIVGVWANFAAPEWLGLMCREDGLIESGTVVVYLLAAGLFIATARRISQPALARWLLAGLLVFIAGEELNWGQRIFGIETPEAVAEHNVQRELSVHNLTAFHGNNRAFGLLFVLALGIGLPLLAKASRRVREQCVSFGVPISSIPAMALFLSGTIVMAAPRLAMGEINFELDELGEFLVGAGFLAFAYGDWARSADNPGAAA